MLHTIQSILYIGFEQIGIGIVCSKKPSLFYYGSIFLIGMNIHHDYKLTLTPTIYT
jgi:hypothetical protein